MEGYDIVLIQSFFAQPSFLERYGSFDEDSNNNQISAAWQTGLSNAVSVGTIVGAFFNGYFTHKFGYRKVLLASLAIMVGFIFIPFFAPSLPVLLVGEFLCGIPWGVFATMSPAYASEVVPMALRGHLTVYVNLCWAIGQLISAGVQSGFSDGQSEWSYRSKSTSEPVTERSCNILKFLLQFSGPGLPSWGWRFGSHQSLHGTMFVPADPILPSRALSVLDLHHRSISRNKRSP